MPQENFRCVYEPLRRVGVMVAQGLAMRSGAWAAVPRLEFPSWEMCLRPGLVLLCSHLYGGVHERSIALAAVLQFIYLAGRVHAAVEEDDSLSRDRRRERCQLPVLLGDYLYARFFMTLCEGGLVQCLSPLAGLICSISEAGLLKRRANTGGALEYEICRKETAELMAVACRLGGELAGAPAADRGSLHRFGLNFGLAYGLNGRVGAHRVREFLARAGAELKKLPDGEARAALEQLLVRFAPPVERVDRAGG